MSKDQRHFTRIPFNATTTLVDTKTGEKQTAELIDISFKGILVKKPDNWKIENGALYKVNLQLAGHEIEINLEVMAVHIEDNCIGFKTEHMDLDTATHLRRLVELNLGSEDLLERELSELVQAS